MAKVLVEYSLGVEPGWMVTIRSSVAGLPLVQAVCRQVLIAGGYPHVQLDVPGLETMLLNLGNDDQLRHVDPYRLLMMEKSDALLNILSETNTRGAGNV